MCHGEDGRSPTVTGLSMYPPAPALDAAPIQQYSDAELFWITKNGIRLTGMPGFGKVYSDEQIWQSRTSSEVSVQDAPRALIIL